MANATFFIKTSKGYFFKVNAGQFEAANLALAENSEYPTDATATNTAIVANGVFTNVNVDRTTGAITITNS